MTELPNYQPQEPDRPQPQPAGPQTLRPDAANVVYLPARGNGPATAALILGLTATLFGLVPIGAFVAAVGAVAAIVLGFIGYRRARDPRCGGRSRAIWGFALGLAGLALSIIGMAIVTDGFLNFDGNVERELQQEMRQFEEDFDSIAP